MEVVFNDLKSGKCNWSLQTCLLVNNINFLEKFKHIFFQKGWYINFATNLKNIYRYFHYKHLSPDWKFYIKPDQCLELACQPQYQLYFKQALEAGADPSKIKNAAAGFGNLEILLQYFNPDGDEYVRNVIFNKACECGHVHIMEKYYEPNVFINNIFWIIDNGHIAVFKFLFSKGYDMCPHTLLKHAVGINNDDMIDLFLANGATIDEIKFKYLKHERFKSLLLQQLNQ